MKLALLVPCVLLLAACKGDIQPRPIPISAPEGAQVLAPCQSLAYGGFPRRSSEKKGTFFVCRDGYALNFDPERKTAEWAVEHVQAKNLAQPNAFSPIDDSRADPQLAVKAQSQNNDYVGVGYVKELLVPSDNYKFNDVLYSHTFYLSNAIVMNPSRVADWKKLEEYVRSSAVKNGEVFVISGSVYDKGFGLGWVGIADKERASGKNATAGKIQVPTHYYKVILIPSQRSAQAFLLPNTSAEKGGALTMISMAELENMAQIRFSPDFSQTQRQERLGF